MVDKVRLKEVKENEDTEEKLNNILNGYSNYYEVVDVEKVGNGYKREKYLFKLRETE